MATLSSGPEGNFPGYSTDEPAKAPMPAPATHVVLTVEEDRLDQPLAPSISGSVPAAAQFLRASGFDRLVTQFSEQLRCALTLAQATEVVRTGGQRLWDSAVARAQGRLELGTLDRYDDRPLYWARTSMTAAVRTLEADYLTMGAQRQGLIRLLDRNSRGMAPGAWPQDLESATRMMVSGFDVYSLDESLRNSNPSGASALQLDGRTFSTAHGPVTVRAVILPVNYTDFDQGIVEDAFGPVLRTGDDRTDMIMTISMTARGRMDIEKWAANARGGSPDNNRNQHFGAVSRPSHWPQPFDSPDWIETTLPYEAMIAARTGPWPVVLREGICEWPAGTFPDPTQLRCQPDPSAGSTAAAGTGGDYLSNESMYRSNRLRWGLQAWDIPGGHLHISALEYPAQPEVLTDDAFEADRRAIVDQTIALVESAGTAIRGARTPAHGGC